MNKTILIICSLVALLVLGFFALNSYIYNEKQVAHVPEPYTATLSGTFVCLPHTDQTGPQTEECAGGILTDAGEYYAVDFASGIGFAHGERFTATGTITPLEFLSTNHWQKYPIEGIFSVTSVALGDTATPGGEAYECNGDAKICPDGSLVGRTGPTCEFAACPSPDATSAQVSTYLGGTATGLNVSVSPQEVISDSRCPAEVQCIWAGTVEVRTVISSPVAHGEHVLTLGTPQTFGDYTVTLIDVTPLKTQEAIPDSSYRFTFEIQENE